MVTHHSDRTVTKTASHGETLQDIGMKDGLLPRKPSYMEQSRNGQTGLHQSEKLLHCRGNRTE